MLLVSNHRQAQYFLFWSFLAPATAWMAQLVASFLLASYDCQDNLVWLYSISAGAVIVSFSGVATALVCQKFYKAKSKSYRFVANLAFWLGLLLTLTVLAQSLPNITIEVCT